MKKPVQEFSSIPVGTLFVFYGDSMINCKESDRSYKCWDSMRGTQGSPIWVSDLQSIVSPVWALQEYKDSLERG